MRRGTTVLLLIAAATTALAATPPGLVNYQGVLRDAANAPREGAHDVVFRLFSGLSTGSEILVDAHTAAWGSAVVVEGGMFSAQIGGGHVTDGSGSGTYTSLADVFRDYGAVYLSVEINGEVLTPRVRIVAAAYAHNASSLGGRAAAGFVDTSSAAQTKIGPVTFDASTQDVYGVTATGRSGGGYFTDADASAEAYAARGNRGLLGYGTAGGGYFEDTNGSGVAYTGDGDYGVRAWGDSAGGYFKAASQSGYSLVGRNDVGIESYGDSAGAYCEDSNGSGYAYVGTGDRGIEAFGNSAGAYCADANSSGYAYVGTGDRGIDARGNEMGGYFADLNGSGIARAGYGNYGVYATGSYRGGYFFGSDATAYGVEGRGDGAGGYFYDTDGTAYALAAYGQKGIEAMGNDIGGYFADRTIPEHAYGYVGYTDTVGMKWGVYGVGYNVGVEGIASGGSGKGRLGYGDMGVRGEALTKGAYFEDSDEAAWANVAAGSYKIYGTGTVNFVQNHPYEKDKVIVYTAPEGDEAATYTRGTARLVGGTARVALGETFRLVTNPDIGLTAHLTPRGTFSDLFVVSLSTEELVVASRDGAPDAVFDYLVYGLRIGFEETSVVQEKEQEAYIPSMATHRDLYARAPGLQRFAALERFRAMSAAAGIAGAEADLSRAAALRTAIGQYDPAVHGPVVSADELAEARRLEETGGGASLQEAGAPSLPNALDAPGARVLAGAVEREAGDTVTGALLLPVSEPVEAFDLLALDPLQPGALRRAAAAGDPLLAGVAAAPSTVVEGRLVAPVVGAGFATVKADAGYGTIRPGDLLASSPTPGHAQLALESPPGTVLGKAVGALDAGTGTVVVLVMPR